MEPWRSRLRRLPNQREKLDLLYLGRSALSNPRDDPPCCVTLLPWCRCVLTQHRIDHQHERLESSRHSDRDLPRGRSRIRPIVAAFGRAASYAVFNGRQLVRDTRSIEADWELRLRGLRSDAAARRVSVLAIAHPVLNYDIVVRELEVSPATAFRALGTRVDRGVLRAANSQRRNRIWLAEPVLRSMDDFAARAGRRRLPQ